MVKQSNSFPLLWRGKWAWLPLEKKLFLDHYSTVGGQTHNSKKFPALLIRVQGVTLYITVTFPRSKVEIIHLMRNCFQFWFYPFALLQKQVCDILKMEAIMYVKTRGCHATELVSELRLDPLFDQWIMKGNKSFSMTQKQHGDKAIGDKRNHVLSCIKLIPEQKKKKGKQKWIYSHKAQCNGPPLPN